MKQAVAAMHQLFENHTRKGISDFNNRFNVDNYGFMGNRCIFLDTGRTSYSQATKENPEPEMARMRRFLSSWLRKKFPQFAKMDEVSPIQ